MIFKIVSLYSDSYLKEASFLEALYKAARQKFAIGCFPCPIEELLSLEKIKTIVNQNPQKGATRLRRFLRCLLDYPHAILHRPTPIKTLMPLYCDLLINLSGEMAPHDIQTTLTFLQQTFFKILPPIANLDCYDNDDYKDFRLLCFLFQASPRTTVKTLFPDSYMNATLLSEPGKVFVELRQAFKTQDPDIHVIVDGTQNRSGHRKLIALLKKMFSLGVPVSLGIEAELSYFVPIPTESLGKQPRCSKWYRHLPFELFHKGVHVQDVTRHLQKTLFDGPTIRGTVEINSEDVEHGLVALEFITSDGYSLESNCQTVDAIWEICARLDKAITEAKSQGLTILSLRSVFESLSGYSWSRDYDLHLSLDVLLSRHPLQLGFRGVQATVGVPLNNYEQFTSSFNSQPEFKQELPDRPLSRSIKGIHEWEKCLLRIAHNLDLDFLNLNPREKAKCQTVVACFLQTVMLHKLYSEDRVHLWRLPRVLLSKDIWDKYIKSDISTLLKELQNQIGDDSYAILAYKTTRACHVFFG